MFDYYFKVLVYIYKSIFILMFILILDLSLIYFMLLVGIWKFVDYMLDMLVKYYL